MFFQLISYLINIWWIQLEIETGKLLRFQDVSLVFSAILTHFLKWCIYSILRFRAVTVTSKKNHEVEYSETNWVNFQLLISLFIHSFIPEKFPTVNGLPQFS
jgi:hypothetical protein